MGGRLRVAEAVNDVAFALAPLDEREARELPERIRARRLLDPFRGAQRSGVPPAGGVSNPPSVSQKPGHDLATTRGLHLALLEDEDVRNGAVHTRWLEDWLPLNLPAIGRAA